jgi:cytochrome c biogenesis protein CcmG, thiol:disulfide interchange protein DsbE
MPGGFTFPPDALCDRHPGRQPNVRIVVDELTNAARQLRIGAVLVAAAALLVAGCGSDTSGEYGGEPPDYATALAGSPPPLTALHRQANELLPGGVDAFEQRIDGLRGYPIVVNVWASWCGPCRFEFPTLQRLSAAYGKRVAFLGVDSEDSDDAARTFLGESPVPFPSYVDGDGAIAEELGATRGLPDTAFYDRGGELVYLKQGPYTDHSELRADIERYALDGQPQGG